MVKTPASAEAGRLAARLRTAGCVYAEEEAELLLAAAPADGATLERMLADRIAGRPLEYILGWAGFCGLRLLISPGVFVPRRRTETLAALASAEAGGRRHAVVVDLCCGSGAVGAVIADRVKAATIYAVDSDAAAVACARANLGNRAVVLQGDLFSALPAGLHGRVDLVVANAPYVPAGLMATLPSEARNHEPAFTRDGGSNGLAVLSRIAAHAPEWLAASGVLMVECAESQAEAVADSFAGAGLDPKVHHRFSADATVVRGVLLPAAGC